MPPRTDLVSVLIKQRPWLRDERESFLRQLARVGRMFPMVPGLHEIRTQAECTTARTRTRRRMENCDCLLTGSLPGNRHNYENASRLSAFLARSRTHVALLYRPRATSPTRRSFNQRETRRATYAARMSQKAPRSWNPLLQSKRTRTKR